MTDGPLSDLHEVGAKGGMTSAAYKRERITGRAQGRDALATGLVTIAHDSEIPRVSPFIFDAFPANSEDLSQDDESPDMDNHASGSPSNLDMAV
jgi:hypothetical protein